MPFADPDGRGNADRHDTGSAGAKHVIHPGRILYVALGVVVMMTFYASTIFGSFAFFADLSSYVSPQRITTAPLSMAAASLGIKLRHCLKAVLIRR